MEPGAGGANIGRPPTILGRLSHALVRRGRELVRGTDWWAVLVEIAVVVLGILIAFELNAWDQGRQARREETALLQRLAEEASSDLRSVVRIRDQHAEQAANFRLLARAVTDPVAHAAYHRRGAVGCNLLFFPAVRRASAGAGGLAAGERLDLVSDPELRKRLRQADAERVFGDNQLPYFRQTWLRYAEEIEPHMRWRFTADGYDCQVDIDSLARVPGTIALLPKLARDQARFAEYRDAEVQATAAVLERVRCLARGDCAAGKAQRP